MNRYTKIFTIVISLFLVIYLFALTPLYTNLFNTNTKGRGVSKYNKQASIIPEPGLRIFYAVKNSLDYGRIDGEECLEPKANILNYSQVTNELLENLNKQFKIDKYSYNDSTYEIIIIGIKNPNKKFKANRNKMFIWKNGNWISIGGYIYL